MQTKPPVLTPKKDNQGSYHELDNQLVQSMELRLTNVKKAIELALGISQKCQELDYANGLAMCQYQLGLFHMIVGENKEAVAYASHALRLYTKLGDKQGMANSYYTIGSVHYKSANLHLGLEYLYDTLKLQKEVNDLYGQSKTLKAIGHIYENFEELEKALESYSECIVISRLNNDKNGESNACNPLSGLFLKNGNVDKALELIIRSISLKEETGDERGLAFAWYGKAKIHFHLKEYQEAIKYFEDALLIHERVGERLGVVMCRLKLGSLFLEKKAYSESKIHLNGAHEMANKMSNEEMLSKVYFVLFEVAMAESNRSEALDFHIQYTHLKDRVFNSESKGKMQSLESMWKMEALENEARVQREKNIVVEGQIEELDRFSSRVSHDLRGPISSLIGLYEVVKSEVTDEVALKYFDLYNNSLTRINQKVVDLLSLSKVKDWKMTRVEIGFEEIIADCIASFSYIPIFNKVNFVVDLDDSLSIQSDHSLISTIIQNLIENSIKYARKDSVEPFVKVIVKQSAEDYFCIIVEDNGIGIDSKYQDKVFDMFYRANDEGQGSGLGMYILKSAVDKLEGEVELKSILGEGTKFVVLLPILDERVSAD